MKETKEKKLIKMKINVGTLVREKVGDMDDKIIEGIIRRMRKEVVVYFRAVVGKKNFLVQFEGR